MLRTGALPGSKEQSPRHAAVSESANAGRQLQFSYLHEELGEDIYIKYNKMIQMLV